MWPLLYRIALAPVASAAARMLAATTPKVRRGLAGRRAQRDAAPRDRAEGSFAVHVHASSVGEFEQAKPIIEDLRRHEHAGLRFTITASFYSPSGFEQQGRYAAIDEATYLPEDRTTSVRRFLDRIDPDVIIVIRYDLWPEFVRQASEREIPIALVCATLAADSPRMLPVARGFFSWLYGRLSFIDCVGADDAGSFERLAPDVPRAISGDTRYDRVAERAAAGARVELPIDRAQLGAATVVVAGSTWPPDESLLVPLAGAPDIRLVVVPHEPTPEHVAELRASLGDAVLLSELTVGAVLAPGMPLIVDRTGILLGLYALADIAYVGGAFGAGVHSVLEPAAYGIPVLSGPRIERSRDASALHDAGLLEIVTSAAEASAAIGHLIADDDARADRGRRTSAFVRDRAGATDRIVAELISRGLLPDLTTPSR